MMKLIKILLFMIIPIMGFNQTVRVKTGIEMLRESGFSVLKQKKVGLITNPTGVDSKLQSSIDIIFQSKACSLVALFGPEHGVRGNFTAGDAINSETDEKTGIPVYSLYGKSRKPDAEMLRGIDVLVYDIQDIGVRSYTYISTMGLAMEAAAENNITFVVLDRPNPLGGYRVEGPLVEDGFFSFVSQFKIPYVYGLTAGELALYLNSTKPDSLRCKLHVVKMKGWNRSMTFEQTGLPWVPASPHIPRANSSFYYAISGILGELDANMIGVGYTLPFEVFATTYANADKVATQMNALNMEGVIFRPIYFKPYYMAQKDKEFSGVQVHITDFKKISLTEIQFRFSEVMHQLYPEKSVFDGVPDRYAMFDKVCGTDKIRIAFLKNHKFDDIKDLWNNDAVEFKQKSEKYYLYK